MSELEVQRTLGRLESKVDTLLEEIRTHADRNADTERRVREVEKDLAQTKTIGGIATMAIATVAAIFPSFWHK